MSSHPGPEPQYLRFYFGNSVSQEGAEIQDSKDKKAARGAWRRVGNFVARGGNFTMRPGAFVFSEDQEA